MSRLLTLIVHQKTKLPVKLQTTTSMTGNKPIDLDLRIDFTTGHQSLRKYDYTQLARENSVKCVCGCENKGTCRYFAYLKTFSNASFYRLSATRVVVVVVIAFND